MLADGVAYAAKLGWPNEDLDQFSGLVLLGQTRRIIFVLFFPDRAFPGWEHSDGIRAVFAQEVDDPIVDKANLEHEIMVRVLLGQLG